jgi:hypothetical protein
MSAIFLKFRPPLALSVVAILISTIIPIYNYAATGEASKNLYTLVWPYDRIGFGDANVYGRSGHTLEKGFRHVRFDLSLMAADLYGWQIGTMTTAPLNPATITPDLQDQLLNQGDYWPLTGISWILLPFGLWIGLQHRRFFIAAWLFLGFVIVAQTLGLAPELLQNSQFAWAWIFAAMAWLCLPLVVVFIKQDNHEVSWTWLLASAALGLIFMHFTYWIGSQRYSTRYYFEALSALSILSAIPLAWLIRKTGQCWLIYGLVAAALVYSLYVYSTPRISVLYRFNFGGP